jgi:predicted small metal-binding protein
MKEFNCRDTGRDCDWTASASSEAEILKLAFKHGREKHDSHNFSENVRESVLDHIRNVKVPAEAT